MNKKSNKGIALTALVVIIIAILIIGAVVIGIAVKGGLFNKDKEVGADMGIIDKYISGETSKEQGNNKEKFSAIYKKTKMYTDENGETAPIPKGFSVGKSDGINTVEEGLVIQDSEGNEFVWIPVEVTENDTETSIASFYRSSWVYNERTTRLSTKYTEPYANGYAEEVSEYNEMLKSVYENKGFYIGRYEAGSTVARTETSNGTTEMVVKRDAYPYIGMGWGASMTDYTSEITYNNKNQGLGALALSKAMYANKEVGVTSTLCYGVMWDAMLEFISTEKNVTDSTEWGNYNNNTGDTWKITRTTASYSEDYGKTWTQVEGTAKEKTSLTSILLTTGANDNFSAKNIFDVAGNVWEWTNEAYTSYHRVYRGGTFFYDGDVYAASGRDRDFPDEMRRRF